MQYRKFDIGAYRSAMGQLLGHLAEEATVFWDALDFALQAHADQWRRSGDPYIMHPCMVARILAEELDVRDPEILAAALLHDTIEDVDFVTPELLAEKFGANVAAIVEGCTKVTHYMGDQQSLKRLVHRKIFTGAAARPEVMLVKLADRLHNLRTLASLPRHKRQRIAAETLDIYAPLSTILGLYGLKREIYNLALAYKFPRQSNRLQLHIDKLRRDPQVLTIVEQLGTAMEAAAIQATVTLRTKGLWGYYDVRNKILIKEIESPQEILITTRHRHACYRALGVLNELYPPIPRTIRDFIANPKPTGYQGLHARANVGGRKFLFKIRTGKMGRQAQRGLVHLWAGKGKQKGRFFREMQEMFDILGRDDQISYRDIIAARGRKEIYTYTPKGDLVCLPVNSIVLDFAFRIHTEIGHSCKGALVGKKRLSPEYVLKDGDVVQIIRQDTPVHFDLDMQKLCQTPRARSELSRDFRRRRQEVSRAIGLSVLQQEMRRYGLPHDLLYKEGMADILAYFNLKSMEDLFLQVGEGRLRLRELLYEVRHGLYVGRETLAIPTGALNRVELSTLDPVVFKISACCHPSPLDKGVIALLSERGLSLHRKDCRRLQKLKFQREDAVEVRWRLRQTRVRKPQKIIVLSATRNRLFMLLSVAPEEMRMGELIPLSPGAGAAKAWEINFTVADLYGLKKIIKHFERSNLRYEFILEQ